MGRIHSFRSSPEDVLEAFCFVSSWDFVWLRSHFPLIPSGLFAEGSSWNICPRLPYFQPCKPFSRLQMLDAASHGGKTSMCVLVCVFVCPHLFNPPLDFQRMSLKSVVLSVHKGRPPWRDGKCFTALFWGLSFAPLMQLRLTCLFSHTTSSLFLTRGKH